MQAKVLPIVLLCVIKAAQNVLGPLGSAFNVQNLDGVHSTAVCRPQALCQSRFLERSVKVTHTEPRIDLITSSTMPPTLEIWI